MTFLTVFLSWVFKAPALAVLTAHLPFLGFWIWVCNNYYCWPVQYIAICYIRNGYAYCS